MNATTVGLDLAKNVFQVHGIDSTGKVIVRRSLRRRQAQDRPPSRLEGGRRDVTWRAGPRRLPSGLHLLEQADVLLLDGRVERLEENAGVDQL